MRADSFAKLVVLQALIDADVGFLLEHRPSSSDQFREGMISRVSDLVDEIDALDAVAAARTYDSLVDFLSELPENDQGIVEATLRFQRSMRRTIERGMDPGELKRGSTWAVVLDELLEELMEEYRGALTEAGEIHLRQYVRALALLARAREATDRLLSYVADGTRSELWSDVERLTFAVRHQRLSPSELEPLIRSLQRRAASHRPTPLTRIGAFVLGQVLSRERRRRQAGPPGGIERRQLDSSSSDSRAAQG